MENILALITVLLSFVFLISFCAKAFAFFSFIDSITQFGIVPKRYVRAVAWCVLIAEAVLAVGLLFSSSPRYFFMMAGLMLFALTGALGHAYVNKNSVHCSCFGESNEKTHLPFAILRNMILITLCLYVLLMDQVQIHFEFERMHLFLVLVECSLIIHFFLLFRRMRKGSYERFDIE
ncbi:hypothetical protein FHS16_004132 [Paenibacillus endophyticus]|uniref:Methylamine utilisation protein MauE domain-containing protein n=1 Tax=Paenibacillus endophyticus TaxID=1294268 RepID=A0A7W5CAC1_9BACL|nr:hypothetical protein [Paenibacillus endophyticus]